MSDPVQLSVRSSLNKIIKEMEAIRDKAEEVNDTFKSTGQQVGDNFNKNVKKTENFLGNLRSLGRRVADQLRGDFRSLLAINALGDAAKLSNQFKGSIRETINLSDSIRKLGSTFGVASKDFASFQTKMVKGLGDIGMSSDVASRTLQGLSETQVRGQENLLGYSKTAGMLGSVAREQGKEGDIARGMANVIQARGGNVNDMKQVGNLAEDLRKVFLTTGKGPTETLKVMEELFANMPKDLRKSITSSGLTNLAAASAVGGPNATKFLEEYLGKSPIARMAFEAQGGKGVFSEKGIDIKKFKAFSQSIMGRVGGDPRLAAQTLGLSEEAAEGFVRLSESLDKVADAQDRISKTTGDLNTQYKQSMGMEEAFKANINKVKSLLAQPLSWISQNLTDALSGASESTGGAAGVVAGGGLLAALLAGFGTRGLGAGMLGGLAKGAAAQAITGKEVQPVYVTNAAEIAGAGALGGAGGMMGKVGGFLGKAGLVGAAAYGGYKIGEMIEPSVTEFLDKNTTGKTSEGFEGNVIERAFFKLDRLLDGRLSGVSNQQWDKQQKVYVELNKRDLKESKQPTRGSSY